MCDAAAQAQRDGMHRGRVRLVPLIANTDDWAQVE